MNLKQLSILLVLVVVLGGAGLMVYKKQNAARGSANATLGKKLLGDFPVNDVAQITIKQGATELTLAKKEDLWRVRERNDYPANYAEISDFLLKARDLKIVQSEKVGASQLSRLSLSTGAGSNAALVVELKDQGGKVIRSLLLGKKHMRKSGQAAQFGMGDEGWPDGRYVKVGAEGDVCLISDALANLEPKPDQWLSKDFLKVEKPRSISVAFTAATNSWKLTRETESGEWKLSEPKTGEQLDNGKASGVASPLASPAFADVVTNPDPRALGLEHPTLVTIDTFEGFSYTLKVGQKTNDQYALSVSVSAQLPKERTPGKDEKAEDKTKLDKEFKEQQKKLEDKLAQEKTYEKWVYLVSTWTLDSLLKERAQLFVDKKEEAKKDGKEDASELKADSLLAPPAVAPKAGDK